MQKEPTSERNLSDELSADPLLTLQINEAVTQTQGDGQERLFLSYIDEDGDIHHNSIISGNEIAANIHAPGSGDK